jgi:hypothetical protein
MRRITESMDRLESKEVVVWLKPGCDYMIFRKDFSTHCGEAPTMRASC